MPRDQMFSLKLEGAKALDRTLRSLGTAARAVLRRALRKAAIPVRDALRDAAPRSDQGEFHAADTMTIGLERSRGSASISLGGGFTLRAGEATGGLSLTAETLGKSKSGDAAVAVGPTKEGFYLLFSEIGTSREPAKAWARAAWDRTKHQALAIFRREIWKQVTGAVKRAARRRR